MHHVRHKCYLFLFTCLLSLSVSAVTFPEPVNLQQGKFIVDQANLLSPKDSATITRIAQKLYRDKKIPLIIVTIKSLGQHGLDESFLSHYDKVLFAHMLPNAYKHGIMLLVVRDSQQFRIQFGPGYGRKYIPASSKILHEKLVPTWNKGKYSQAISQSAQAIASMVD